METGKVSDFELSSVVFGAKPVLSYTKPSQKKKTVVRTKSVANVSWYPARTLHCYCWEPHFCRWQTEKCTSQCMQRDNNLSKGFFRMLRTRNRKNSGESVKRGLPPPPISYIFILHLLPHFRKKAQEDKWEKRTPWGSSNPMKSEKRSEIEHLVRSRHPPINQIVVLFWAQGGSKKRGRWRTACLIMRLEDCRGWKGESGEKGKRSGWSRKSENSRKSYDFARGHKYNVFRNWHGFMWKVEYFLV